MARSRYYQFALSSTRAAHLGSPGSPGRCTSNIALIPIGGIQQWALDISASAIGARMQQPHLTATAVEKLKRSAKKVRNETGCSLAFALDQVASEAGYPNCKRVTELLRPQGQYRDELLPPMHYSVGVHVWGKDGRPKRFETVNALCEALGGVRPYLIRKPCEYAKPDEPCMCQVDHFATSVQANIGFDVGDKHDFWRYLYMLDRPATSFPGWVKRVKAGLGTGDHSPNEHLTIPGSNDDRSNTLNPNNDAYKAAADNHSDQLNPNNPRYKR